MGTITARPRKDGGIAYTAQIRITRGGKRHTEAQTFDKRAAAKGWLTRREAELQQPGALDPVQQPGATLADAIDQYVRESPTIGRTKTQVLRAIKRYDIAAMRCEAIESQHIVTFATELSIGRKPQTVGNYLSHLAAIFAIAGPAWGFPLNPEAMAAATKVAKRLGKTSKSQSRDRRPTLDELDAVMEYAGQRRQPSLPMQRIIAFAIFSTRRQAEITRLLWSDLDEANSRILVRDMKHPGEKIGNHVWVDLPEPALKIAQAMPRTALEIFPFDPGSISASFTRACQFLEIKDLDFHDLRHDGVSRLFEMGASIPKAAAVSGHRSWASLKRYTHMRGSGDKYEGWRWLPAVQLAIATDTLTTSPPSL